MKILFSSTGKEWEALLDGQFGRAQGFVLYDEASGKVSWHSNAVNVEATHGAGTQAAQFAASTGAEVIITGHVGPKAYQMLNLSEIKVYIAPEESLTEVYDAFKRGELKQQAE